ncbi:F5/8 type C domain protein [Planctomycetes bacterium K2D]|uniref:F5/8 type C domain protein n=2 Tax=Botrimarina mediterranea TaxID=2528022 RepID=A0A518KCS0_9BACT|nr:F5/8 type C domain protein [Botrimarina mediterranea]QDV80225.1 F5/8 type C domain protein [Planctomycetes bacterium K2D]
MCCPRFVSMLCRRTSLRVVAAAAVAAPGAALALNNAYNLAPYGTATATGSDFGGEIAYGIDGNRNGDFNAGSVFYGNANAENPPLFYAVDLGVEAYVDRIQIIPRTDATQGVFGNFRLTIAEDDGAGNPGAVVFSQDYNATNFESGTWATTAPDGARGRHVRMERLDNNYWLTFAEFEVFGSSEPLKFSESDNIARGKPVTVSSAPGFGAMLTSANDGNINGNFGGPGNRPVYHSALPGVGESWQVDLGAETQLDHLQLFTRGEFSRNDETGEVWSTTTEYRVSVLDAGLSEVGAFVVTPNALYSEDPDYDLLINTMGLTGRYVRVETTKDEYLAFSELRAFAGSGDPLLVGDYNQDGVISSRDYNVWRNEYGSLTSLAADGNGDGAIDAADYTVWRDALAAFTAGSPSMGVTIPEPTTLALVAAVGLVAVRRRG